MAAVGSPGGARDRFDQELSMADPGTLEVWDLALREILDFRGEPAERLQELTADDEAFVMGLVVTLTWAILGGDDPQSATIQDDLQVLEARCRNATDREQDHAVAVTNLVAGDFTKAASRWNAIGAAHPQDLVATKAVHDVYLHVGDDTRRLRSSTAAIERLALGDPGYGVAAGQHAYALEEVGRFEEAERFARIALGVDPVDVWALHAIAHVYETQDRQEEAVDFLRATRPDWIERDHLALHLEWHLALRLLAGGSFGECLELVDGRLATTDRAFGLCDLTSLLWRLELAGCDVGDRWPGLATKWRNHDQLHTTGFLDLHAALAFSACPDDPGAANFWAGLDACHRDGASENDRIFDEVVRPLADALRDHRTGRHRAAVDVLDGLAATCHQVGGSHAQRDLFARTANASRQQVDPAMNATRPA